MLSDKQNTRKLMCQISQWISIPVKWRDRCEINFAFMHLILPPTVFQQLASVWALPTLLRASSSHVLSISTDRSATTFLQRTLFQHPSILTMKPFPLVLQQANFSLVYTLCLLLLVLSIPEQLDFIFSATSHEGAVDSGKIPLPPSPWQVETESGSFHPAKQSPDAGATRSRPGLSAKTGGQMDFLGSRLPAATRD